MKKAFTMIELIFVIVILGILSAVALPRLAATRDDAQAVKLATNIRTAINDLSAYYTANGKFSKNFKDMTNIEISDAGVTNYDIPYGYLKINKKVCVGVDVVTMGDTLDVLWGLWGTTRVETAPASVIKLTFGYNDENSVCKALRKLPAIKSMCGQNEVESLEKCEIIVGGSNVNW